MPYVLPLGNHLRVGTEAAGERLEALDSVPGDRLVLPGQEDVGDGAGP